MTAPHRYPIPADRARAEDVIDRSRFICSVARAETAADAQAFIREISAEFPDATHHCWAYVAGPPGSTTHIGMSDDGEPHGTAGRPMLTVLLHANLGEVVAVVTRYYGGVKLGTGGLARAYAGAVQSGLAVTPTRERVEYGALRVTVSYANFSAVQHLLAAHEATVLEEQFTEQVTLGLQVPLPHLPALRAAIGNATSGQAVFSDDAA
jgi:uncharacterized YigZ family protein